MKFKIQQYSWSIVSLRSDTYYLPLLERTLNVWDLTIITNILFKDCKSRFRASSMNWDVVQGLMVVQYVSYFYSELVFSDSSQMAGHGVQLKNVFAV